ncbi:MAG: hypothetical protein HY537_01020, partial [Deltaproteobacteria bacterium]|nr:hypothetical protein [Deltaproteobacteria bacterium]
SIIITDTGSNIGRIQEILVSLDIKGFETTLHVLRIKNSAAKTISEMLTEIYGEDKKGGTRSFRKTALERTRGGGIISKIIPDEATNSLVVLANQAGFEQLKHLVGKLDVKVTDTGRIHVYYCEYAKAEDLAQTLAALSQGSAGGGKSPSTRRPTTPAGGAPGTTPTTPSGPTGPVSAELEGGVKVTSDAATNALVVIANSADYKTLRKVLKRLDIPRLQVFVETAIVEVSIGKGDKWSLNWGAARPDRLAGGGFMGNQKDITDFVTSPVPPAGVSVPILYGPTFTVQVPNGSGGTTPMQISNLYGLVEFISTLSNTSILSTPQILALDNEKATFKVQDKIPTIKSFPGSQTTTTAVSPGSIETIPVGIEVTLTPHVNAASKTIRLDLEQTVESQNIAVVPKDLQGKTVGTTSRVTNTSVTVKDQNFVMLGGLMHDKVDEITTKFPILGDIPILGWLFKSKSWDVIKSNLIILLRPQIIGTTLDAANVTQQKLQKRDKFIDKYVGGEDSQKDDVDQLKQSLEEQARRGQGEPAYDYRNNRDEEAIEDEKPQDTPELTKSPDKKEKSETTPQEKAPLLPAQPQGTTKSEEGAKSGGDDDFLIPPQNPSSP